MASLTAQRRPIARTTTAISANPPMSANAIARPDMADIVVLIVTAITSASSEGVRHACS